MTGERSHVFEITDSGTHLNRCPCAGLALLAHDNLCELLLALADAVGHLHQVACTLDGGGLCPCLLCCTGGIKGAVHVFYGAFWLAADDFLCRGVQHIDPLAVRTFAELAVDVHL